jgi:hypothetical protein
VEPVGIEDVDAELIIAGCAVASPEGAAIAHRYLTADMFTRPYLRDLFTVSIDLPPRTVDSGESERISEAARRTGINEADIALLVRRRPVLTDKAGGYAERVWNAWQRRQALLHLTDAFEAIARGANINEVLG